MWPSLYWCTEMCETTERATDSRRVAAAAVSVRNAALSDDENEEQAEEESGRRSVKRSFMRKVFSPIIGYGQDFQLLQFAYDLTMWSRIGGGKNACAGAWFSRARPSLHYIGRANTRHLLTCSGSVATHLSSKRWRRGSTASPIISLSWTRWRRAAGGMQLAGLETLRTAHVFTEFNRGPYSGRNKTTAKDGWKDHLLASTLPNGGQPLSAPGVSGREAEASDSRLSWQRTRARP